MQDERSQCGAPRLAGLTACSFCETAYPDAPVGIDCPQCGILNEILTDLAGAAVRKK